MHYHCRVIAESYLEVVHASVGEWNKCLTLMKVARATALTENPEIESQLDGLGISEVAPIILVIGLVDVKDDGLNFSQNLEGSNN